MYIILTHLDTKAILRNEVATEEEADELVKRILEDGICHTREYPIEFYPPNRIILVSVKETNYDKNSWDK